MLLDNLDLLYLIAENLSIADIYRLSQLNRASHALIPMMLPYLIRKQYPFLASGTDQQAIMACRRFHWHAQKLSQLNLNYGYEYLIREGGQYQGDWSEAIIRLNLLDIPAWNHSIITRIVLAPTLATYLAYYCFDQNLSLTIEYFTTHRHPEWSFFSNDQICTLFLQRYSQIPSVQGVDDVVANYSKIKRFLDHLLFDRD